MFNLAYSVDAKYYNIMIIKIRLYIFMSIIMQYIIHGLKFGAGLWIGLGRFCS